MFDVFVFIHALDERVLEWLARETPVVLLDVIDWALALDRAEQCTEEVTLHNTEPRSETVVECLEAAAAE